MNIVLGSAFRNSFGTQIDRWAKQCRALQDLLYSPRRRAALGLGIDDPLRFRVVAVEGDSTDRTRWQLHQDCKRQGLDLDLRVCNHGCRVFGSTEEQDRLTALSQVGNAILSGVNEHDDVMVYIESDLLWSPETIIRLISLVLEGYGVIAPLIFAGENFYDIFVYRGLDGNRFGPFPPYHPHLSLSETLPVEVASAGSCLVMRGEVARRCRIRDNMALLGFCVDVRGKGYRIFVDKRERIYHP